MVINMKPLHKIDDLIFYMNNNEVHSSLVLSINAVETCSDDKIISGEHTKVFTPFGQSGIRYATIHGIFKEQHVYSTREKLLESL